MHGCFYKIINQTSLYIKMNNITLNGEKTIAFGENLSGKYIYENDLIMPENITFETYHIPTTFIIWIVSMYIFVIMIGVGGNIFVCYAVCTVRRLQTVTNFFLTSLSVSDILMTMLCVPTTIFSNIIFQHWVLGPFMCPALHYIQLVVVLQRSFVMVAVTCDRHVIVSRPFSNRMSKRTAKIFVLLLWFAASLIAFPTAIYSRVIYLPQEPGSHGLCIEHWHDQELQRAYSIIILVLQYFTPLIIMMCSYIHIGYIIWMKPTPGEPDRERDRKIAMSKRKSLRLLFIVVVTYAITWLPLHVFTLIGDSNPSFFDQKFAHMLWLCFHWLAFSNSGMNPVIYCLINRKFQKKFKIILQKMFCACKSQQTRKENSNPYQNSNSPKIIRVQNVTSNKRSRNLLDIPRTARYGSDSSDISCHAF